jgi:hypothetical protein
VKIRRKEKQGGDIQGMGIRMVYKGRKSEKMRNREACMDGGCEVE